MEDLIGRIDDKKQLNSNYSLSNYRLILNEADFTLKVETVTTYKKARLFDLMFWQAHSSLEDHVLNSWRAEGETS